MIASAGMGKLQLQRCWRDTTNGFASRFVAVLAVALICIPGFAQTAARTTQLLDKGWQFYALPGFTLWPSQPQLTAEQIKQLTIPPAGDGWKSVNLPDDYVVRGEFSEQPNAALLAGGATCAIGVRECEVASGSSPAPRPASPNTLRSMYGGHGYLPLYPAWYKRSFSIPASSKDKTIWLEFGGVYRDAIIFGNGDPASHENNVGNQSSAFRGLCMVLLRASDRPGTITVQAQAEGLPPEHIAITAALAVQSR